MGCIMSCISSQDGEDADNFSRIEDAKEQKDCDNCNSFPEGCGACGPKTRNDPPLVPTIPPSPAIIRSSSAFQNLPDELLLQVTAFLPPVYLVSLSYTCRYFRRFLNCSIKDVLGWKNPSGKSSRKIRSMVFKAQRLELLCLLERDGKIPHSKLICGTCSMTHAKSSFLPACAGMIGQFWLSPHETRSIGKPGHLVGSWKLKYSAKERLD